ncbi:phosphate starvation-inducible protein PhoH [Streptomyces anulatus]|nr:PhoH family protein [Streptomyces europaeiscabiei]KPL34430.1 phosphate starvation-inducible protein PhoH [Streptomyces anulatus]KQX28550.1 phosphate starvation-inducible protein PhoH [Streptomyces sp. Root1295]KRA49590.1 phosphate starvation-inducible protein PhoH [Streptomyces sp. Root63]OKI79956.1 phosphate starvation-inducible protein PhoH [Streptomyces sp. TSRI0395]OKJ55846.1 phosphate starvation-inducible protein PhoH [Streptomyces sp. CB02115]
MVMLLGSGDSLLRVIEEAFPAADIHVRGNEISATGEAADVALIQRLFDEMMLVLRTGAPMTEDAVERSIAMLRAAADGLGDPQGETPAEVLTQNILSNRGRTIRPKTLNQKRYVDAIDQHTIVFGIGPAGTGKTYLAMAKAVQALQSKQVSRIILTRPAVEAGERLGFLPGTLFDKIDPYLRPLYDALHDMLDPDSIPRLMAAGTIEVAPLAYMRGRTLNDAFIILDEAQNTSAEQMKMFLTRLGFDSKIVITGDVTQVDLPSGTKSGLRQVQDILEGLDDVHFSRLTSQDVVRHKLVGRIVDAYEKYDSRNGQQDGQAEGREDGRRDRRKGK